MNPQAPQEQRLPSPPPEGRPPILPWQEFEEAMKFSMDGGQRAAHAAKMHAEADEIRANTRMTNANAARQENKNFWFTPKVIVLGLLLFVTGIIAGILLQRHIGITPW